MVPYFIVSNYVRRHQTIKATPACKAGAADRAWAVADLGELAERYDL